MRKNDYRLEPNAALARWTQRVLLLIVLVSLASAGLSALNLNFHQPGVRVGYAELSRLWAVLRVTMGLYIFLLLIAAVLFFQWLHRAFANLVVMERSLRFLPNTAVGAFFIPFLNIVQPYQVFRDLIDQYGGIAQAFPDHAGGKQANVRGMWFNAHVVLGGFWAAILVALAGIWLENFDNAPAQLLSVIAHGAWVLPSIALIQFLERLVALEAVAHAACHSGAYAEYQSQQALAQQSPAQRGKNATWYREAEDAQGMMDDIDPFSA